MRTIAAITVLVLCLLYSPAWGHEEAEEAPAHHGCAWWGVVGAAYAPLYGHHLEHEATLELAAACVLRAGHTELSLEPNILVPFTLNGDFQLGIAPGFNATWYLYNTERWHVGPRAGVNLRGNVPVGHDGGIGVMWHAGAEAEYELVHEKLGLFWALQYAGVSLWSLGEHVEHEGVAHGPELIVGISFR